MQTLATGAGGSLQICSLPIAPPRPKNVAVEASVWPAECGQQTTCCLQTLGYFCTALCDGVCVSVSMHLSAVTMS